MKEAELAPSSRDLPALVTENMGLVLRNREDKGSSLVVVGSEGEWQEEPQSVLILSTKTSSQLSKH